MISIKEYAESRGITYEAARKSITMHEKELEGHIMKQGRTRLLDNEAVELLDNKRAYTPVSVVVADPEQQKRIEELERVNAALNKRMEEMQKMVMEQRGIINGLQNDKINLLEAKTVLLEDKAAADRDRIRMEVELEKATADIEKAAADLEKEKQKYIKTWFGLYKKVD